MALSEKEAAAYSPNVLAFYGDCVYEKLVRRRVVLYGNTGAGMADVSRCVEKAVGSDIL